VAEAALMMMLMLARRVDAARAAFRSRVIGEPIGSELHGKQLGIIGLGKSGRCLAAAAQGMGMQVGRPLGCRDAGPLGSCPGPSSCRAVCGSDRPES
jgi:hypothetical protein